MNRFKNFYLHIGRVMAAFLIILSLPALAFAAGNTTGNSGNSENWSGYVAAQGTYSGVGATWTVPVPQNIPQTNLAADATWVGIGGLSTHDLIQAGTQAIVQNGSTQYQAWYEALPDSQQILSTLTIHGGDSVSVDLKETTLGTWHLTFKNLTTGIQTDTDIQYRSSHSSADWIEEMPFAISDSQSGYLPLDQFGTVRMTNAYTVVNGTTIRVGGAAAMPITMATREAILAQPSSLSNDSFSVMRTNATVASSFPSTRRGVHRTGSDTSGFVGRSQPPESSLRTPSMYRYSGPGYQIQVVWY